MTIFASGTSTSKNIDSPSSRVRRSAIFSKLHSNNSPLNAVATDWQVELKPASSLVMYASRVRKSVWAYEIAANNAIKNTLIVI